MGGIAASGMSTGSCKRPAQNRNNEPTIPLDRPTPVGTAQCAWEDEDPATLWRCTPCHRIFELALWASGLDQQYSDEFGRRRHSINKFKLCPFLWWKKSEALQIAYRRDGSRLRDCGRSK